MQENFTQAKWGDLRADYQQGDIFVSENLNTRLLAFSWTWDRDGRELLAFELLGIPVVTTNELRPDHSIYFRKGDQAWRPDDKLVHFAGAISDSDFKEALEQLSTEASDLDNKLKTISGQSRAKKMERVALFPSPESYRAFKLGKMYYTIYQLCSVYKLTVVYVPTVAKEFWNV